MFDALDDFRYRVVEMPGDGESWHTLAARALQEASLPRSNLGVIDTMDAYVAGPAGFTDACRRLLLASGLPEERLKTDSLD